MDAKNRFDIRTALNKMTQSRTSKKLMIRSSLNAMNANGPPMNTRKRRFGTLSRKYRIKIPHKHDTLKDQQPRKGCRNGINIFPACSGSNKSRTLPMSTNAFMAEHKLSFLHQSLPSLQSWENWCLGH